MVRCLGARPACDRVLATNSTILETVSTWLLSFLLTFRLIPCEFKYLISLPRLMVVFWVGVYLPKSFHRYDLASFGSK